jgi:hypothetical protein
LFVSSKTLPEAAKLIIIKNQKDYEKNFTFPVLVANSGKLRNFYSRQSAVTVGSYATYVLQRQ